MQKRYTDAQSEARKRVKAVVGSCKRISGVADKALDLTDAVVQLQMAAGLLASEGDAGEYEDLMTRVRAIDAACSALGTVINAHTARLEAEGKAATDRIKFLDNVVVVVPPLVFTDSRGRVVGDQAAPPPRPWFADDDMPEYMRLAIERYEAEKRAAVRK